MNKIQRVSLFFRVLFQITFIVLPLFLAISWIEAPKPLDLLSGTIIFDTMPAHSVYPILMPLTTTTKILGFVVNLIPTGVQLFVLYFLIKLFRLYEKGEIFSLENVRYIKKVGYTLLIGQLINPIYDVLLSLTLTWNNHLHGIPRYAMVEFSGTNFGILLTALMVILISWIMAEGCRLRDEQQYTI